MSNNPDLPVHIEGYSNFTLIRVDPDPDLPSPLVFNVLWVAKGHPNEAIVLYRFAIQPDENTTELFDAVIPDVTGDVLITSYEIRTGLVMQEGGFIAPSYIIDAKEWKSQ